MKLRVDYVFSTAPSRIEGLQGKSIGDFACAVFVYEDERRPRFHMGTVPYELFLSSVVGGVCAESYRMEPGSGDVYQISGPTCCVIESRKRIPVGSSVDLVDGWLVVS